MLELRPNSGGGFTPRPVRPTKAWRQGVSLLHQPASTQVVHTPVDPEQHQDFAREISTVPVHRR